MNTVKTYTLWKLLVLIAALTLAACGPLTSVSEPGAGTPTIVLELVDTETPTPTVVDATVQPTPSQSVGVLCQSESLKIALTLPNESWSCDPGSQDWLSISSPTFEIQMSTLGRGFFCAYPADASCGRAAFYANDVMELDLWSASGATKEIFGFTRYQREGASLWIAIKYQDMETRPLDASAKEELLQLLDSVRETNTAEPIQKPVLVTQGRSRVRMGPGLHYADYYFLSGGTTLPILGRNDEGTWWAVPGPGDGPGPYGWISAAIVTVQGSTGDIPILPATPVPPTPWPETGLPVLGSADAPPADSCVVYQNGRVRDEDLPYVHSGPGASFGVIGQLGRNRWAAGLRVQDGWFEILVAQGETGWVATSGVGWNELCPTLQPEPVRVQFAAGTSSATLQGTLDGETQARYVLWAAADQTMRVDVTSPNNSVLFHVQGVRDGQVYKYLLDGELSWLGVLPLSQDYLVTLDAVGGTTSYTMHVSIVDAPTPDPSAVRIQFPAGATSVTLEGMLEPPQRDSYLFRALAGQRTTIEIVSEFNRANFGLSGVSDGQPYKRVENEERVWSAVLPQTQDYLLTVAAPADAPTTGYRLFLTIEPLE